MLKYLHAGVCRVYYTKKTKKNKFLTYLDDKTKPLRRRLGIFYHKLKIKGRERLTIMFIPHSEKRIFNFHISNFTLFFALIAVSLIVTIAIFSIEKQETTYKRQVAYQSANYQIKIQLNKFVEITNELVSRTKRVKTTLNQLFNLTGLSSESFFVDMNARGGPALPLKNKQKKNSEEDITEINLLKKVHSDTLTIGQRINRLSNHMKRFKRIANNYPSIWPLIGGGALVKGFGEKTENLIKTPSSGIIIKAFPGTPIRSTANGTVTKIGYSKKHGLYCVIRHGYGFSSKYGYLQDLKVKVGQSVKKGIKIGEVGTTGSALGYGLLYEIRIGTKLVDPADFISLDNYW